MGYERRPDRRPGRPGGNRPDRGGRERGGFGGERPPRDRALGDERPQRERGGYADRPQRERGGFSDRPPRERPGFSGERPGRGFSPRDEGGMSIRLDPRRLSALKLLAAEAGMRPGELVTAWVEERLDAERRGGGARPQADGTSPAVAQLAARLDELTRRVDALATQAPMTDAPAEAAAAPAPAPAETAEAAEAPGAVEAPAADEAATPSGGATRRRGRPRKAGSEPPGSIADRPPSGPRVPLHEEIAAIIGERGPMTAGELAGAITERGRYSAPRSSRPIDAATVNSRVSNPAYRDRFTRSDGRIALAERG